MHRKLIALTALLILVAAALSAPALAQDDNIIVDGLVNPRNIAFDADGTLYVAEAGNGGSLLTSADDPYGAASRVIRVSADGTLSVAVSGLISYRQGNSLGASAVHVTDESLWVLLGETAEFSIPFTHALVELDKETGRVKTFVDLLTIELEEDPDGNPNMQSNPTDFAVAPDGTIYIANAGCNCLLSWTPDTGVQVAVAWPFENDNPVPTAVEVDANGDIYVAFLTGFPWPEGGARIEKWSGGELVETYSGLNALTGLLVTADGTIYAVEIGLKNQAPGPGRVVMVAADGTITPVMEDLPAPFGIAQAPDGTIVVSIGAMGGEGGAVIALPDMME